MVRVLKNKTKKIFQAISSKKIKALLFDYAVILNIEDDCFIKIAGKWRIITHTNLFFLDGSDKDVEILQDIHELLLGKGIIKIIVDEQTQDLRLFIEEGIIIDIFTSYSQYESWEINTKNGNVVLLPKRELLFFE